MTRWFTLFALPLLLVGVAACGGGDDDDDDDNSNPFGDSGDERRTDSSGGSGSLTVDGKDYTLDMETCELGEKEKLTVVAASIKGESNSDFSASGIADLVAIALRLGDTAYIAVAAELDIDGDSAKWDGDLLDPANPGKTVKGKFSFKC